MRCPICNQVIGGITPSHIKKHGYTNSKELFKDFPQLKQENDRLNKAYDMKSKRIFRSELKKGGIQS